MIVPVVLALLGKAVELGGRWSGWLEPKQQALVWNIALLAALLSGGAYAAIAAFREGNLIAACFKFPGSDLEQPHLKRLNDNFAAFMAILWAICVSSVLIDLHRAKP